MLEGKTRIPPVDVDTLPDVRETLEDQRQTRGAPLYPYLFYARNPAYFRAAKAMAALDGRDHALPDDVQALAPAVLAHRLALAPGAITGNATEVVVAALERVPAI